MASSLELNVVTPEKSIVNGLAVEAIVLPGHAGQLTILPGYINFLTMLKLGAFGYKTNGEWSVAFLTGGFAQVFEGKTTVLAETLEMSQELDVASAERELQEVLAKVKAATVGTPDYAALVAQKDFAAAKLLAANKKLH